MAEIGRLCGSVGQGIGAEVTASGGSKGASECLWGGGVGGRLVLAGFDDGVSEVMVKGGCGCDDLRCLVVRASDGKSAVVACPKSYEGEHDGCVCRGVVIGIKKDCGEFVVALLLSNGEDGVSDVNGMLKGQSADFWELLLSFTKVG